MKKARFITEAYKALHVDGDVVDADGNVNWAVAFSADPGIRACPLCGESYWNEAGVMQCECGGLFGDSMEVFKQGAIQLALELNLATGHAETWQDLFNEVYSQVRSVGSALEDMTSEIEAVGSVSIGTLEKAQLALGRKP